MIDGIIRQKLIHENKNFILIVTGQPGSGKTYSCLSIAERVDPKFSVDHIALPGEGKRGLIPLLNSGTLKRGNMVVMEEAGVMGNLSARDWQSFSNKAINTVLQTFRHENIGLIMNVPFLKLIDSQARRLCHGYGEMLYIDRKLEAGIMKYFNVSYSSRYDRIFYKYPFVLDGNKWIQVKSIAIPKPSDALLAEYKPLEKKFKVELREMLGEELIKRKELKEEKEENKKDPIDLDNCVKEVTTNPIEFIGKQKRVFLLDAIREHFDCTYREARIIKRRGEEALGMS